MPFLKSGNTFGRSRAEVTVALLIIMRKRTSTIFRFALPFFSSMLSPNSMADWLNLNSGGGAESNRRRASKRRSSTDFLFHGIDEEFPVEPTFRPWA